MSARSQIFWESDPMCNIRPLLWHDAVFLLFAYFLFIDLEHWTYVKEPHPLSEGKHRTFLCHIGQFCAINHNCNSRRPTHLVDREHSNHNTWVSSTLNSSSNMPEWAQQWTHISSTPPILAICGEHTALIGRYAFKLTCLNIKLYQKLTSTQPYQ